MVDVEARDYFTEQFENNGTPQDSYVDSAGHLNFGYGVDVTANETTVSGVPGDDVAVDAILDALVEDPDLSDTDWTTIQTVLSEYVTGTITASSAETQLNDALEDISGSDLATDNENAMDLFFDDSVVPSLQMKLGTAFFNNLPSNIQTALEEIKYNASISFLGSKIVADLDTGDYAGVAYELAFHTAASSDTAYENRSLVAASQVLGFDPSINGFHTINGLSTTSDTSNATLVSFAADVADYAPPSYFSTTPVEGFLEYFDPYILPLGYYLTQNADEGFTYQDTADNIVTNNSISIVDGTELYRLNQEPYSYEGNFNVGGLVYVPLAEDTSISGYDTLSSLVSADPNGSYVYDPAPDNITGGPGAAYALPNLVPQDAALAGQLQILDDAGTVVMGV